MTFVSQAAYDAGVHRELGLQKRVEPVRGCRSITKKDMIHNGETPLIEVNPETYEVKVDGKVITCEPVSELPMAQRYFLF
ncbi:urease subunit alpha [Mycobacterium tuberculosis]|nr:urease subunit alpha [Mycobacterium tuberculosis]